MTVVAALREHSDCVLIAADSLITEADGIRTNSDAHLAMLLAIKDMSK